MSTEPPLDATEEQFRQFYGIGTDEAPARPDDIDDATFIPEQYFGNFITSNGLSALHQKEKTLHKEIRSFDGDLQALVYDNYTKFLKAEETVHLMSGGLSNLSEKMQSVLTSLEVVSKKALEIRKDLEPNRNKIQTLLGKSRLFQRVDFISRLPFKLKANIDIGEYETAVDIWCNAEKVLETQTHFESFVRIRDECRKIIDDVKIKVRGQMVNKSASSHEAIKCAATLIKLDVPAPQTLQELTKTQMEVILDKLNQFSLTDQFAVLDFLEAEIVAKAMDFFTEYQASLLKFSKEIHSKTLGTDKMDEYMLNMKKEIFTRSVKMLKLQSICSLSSADFAKFMFRFSATAGRIGTLQQLQSFIQWLLQKYIHTQFEVLEKSTIDKVTNCEQTGEAFMAAATDFKRGIKAIVVEFDILVKELPDACHHILQEMSKLFSNLLSSFDAVEPRSSLVAFGLALNFSEKLIAFSFEVITRFDPESPLLDMQKTLKADASTTASKCLSKYLKLKRTMLTEIIQQGITSSNWAEARTPHDASISITMLIQELSLVFHQLEIIIGGAEEGSSTSSKSSLSSKRTYTSSVHSGSQAPLFHGLREDSIHQIDRLFTTVNRLQLAKSPKFEAKNILTAIAMYALKSLLEFVRMETFSCAGFNQIQVDCFFIYMAMNEKMDEQSLFNALLEEIVSTSADRAIEPVPFKTVVLNEIYSRSESKPAGKDQN